MHKIDKTKSQKKTEAKKRHLRCQKMKLTGVRSGIGLSGCMTLQNHLVNSFLPKKIISRFRS